MWLKICGSLMVISAGAGIGFSLAGRYGERTRQIGQLIVCLTVLKSCVNYMSTPLPEALGQCVNGVEGPVSDFFRRTGELLSANTWMSPRRAFETVLTALKAKLVLGAEEQETLLQMAANLGTTNRDEQQKYLHMVIEVLEKIEAEARRARERNEKMFRYLGVCAGLAIAILLV
jgi:stage III sporulation protein AB